MSDIFPIRDALKQGDALSPLLFNFALEYTIMRVQVNQDGLKLSGTYQLLVYADMLNYWEEVYVLKEKRRSLLVANMETGIEVNADKTKYIVMYLDQNAGRSRNIKTDNISFEMMERFKYLGTTLTNQNSIQEEIKSRLKSGNACYYSVQNLLSSS